MTWNGLSAPQGIQDFPNTMASGIMRLKLGEAFALVKILTFLAIVGEENSVASICIPQTTMIYAHIYMIQISLLLNKL